MYLYIYIYMYVYLYLHIYCSIDCEKQKANVKASSCTTHGGALDIYTHSYKDVRYSLLFPLTEEIRDGSKCSVRF